MGNPREGGGGVPMASLMCTVHEVGAEGESCLLKYRGGLSAVSTKSRGNR